MAAAVVTGMGLTKFSTYTVEVNRLSDSPNTVEVNRLSDSPNTQVMVTSSSHVKQNFQIDQNYLLLNVPNFKPGIYAHLDLTKLLSG